MKHKKNGSLKAFTLVELIVVMVILAILVALMLPSLTKYIDKADYQTIMVEGRSAFTAAQSAISEVYGITNELNTANSKNYPVPVLDKDGKITVDNNGNVKFNMSKCARLSNSTFKESQSGTVNASNPSIEAQISKKILYYLDSYDTKNPKNVKNAQYDFTKGSTKLGWSGCPTAEKFFSNNNCDVGMTVYYDAAKGKVIAVLFAKRGCDKIAVVTDSDIQLTATIPEFNN